MIFTCFSVSGWAQTSEQEANLKAAFIYNFTKYISWETNNEESDFIIGVVGESPITASLNEIAKTSRVNNKRIIIRVFENPGEIGHCNILFIPRENSFPLQAILERASKGMLTISEEPGFAKQGTAFNFIVINNKLKFEANLRAISSAGLKAGSQLLKLAIIVS